MGKKIVITGASGMVGKGVLLECLQSDQIDSVLVINRQSIDLQHPKLKEVILKDFFNPEEIKSHLLGYDACFFCLGVSSAGMSQTNYHHITFDLTTGFAHVFLQASPESVFVYVSGTGTDSSEKGRIMWARVKGKTENTLLNMGFKKAYMFRPGYIQPLKGVKSKTVLYQGMYNVFKPIYAILKHFPAAATNTINMGKAMINATKNLPEISILENKDINALAE